MRISDQQADRLRVLKAIRRAEPVARADLVELTGLRSQVISEITAELVKLDLLIEERSVPVGRGRPRILLRLNAQAAHVVGACLFPDRKLAVAISDLRGVRLSGEMFELAPDSSVEELAEQIAARVEATLAASPVRRTQIHSLGLALPAVVEPARGVLHWLPGHPLEPAPIADMLARRLHLRVFVDNVANILARAEHWFGADRLVDDFTLIHVDLGIGLGQYVDGVLRTGETGMSSGFAHVKLAIDAGPPCVCGGRGCLLTYAGMSGIVGRFSELRGQAAPSLAGLQAAFDSISQAARLGDPQAQDVFETAGAALGTATASYINTWDPRRIVVVVRNAVFAQMIAEPFERALGAATLTALHGRASVQWRTREDTAFEAGAAALVLEHLYQGRD